MNKKRFATFAVAIICSFGLASAYAERIAVIGTGDVANALGPAFADLGHEIIYGSRDPNRDAVRELVARTGPSASATSQALSIVGADAVLLAVPWFAVEEVVANLGNLSGKIVIDPTNPRIVGDDGLRDYAVETSNGEMIQNWAPNAYVVKAFNTMDWETMLDPAGTGGPVTVPLVGNDAAAKAFVSELVAGLGLEPIDLGPIRYAHAVESLYLLWGNAGTLGSPFNYHFRRVETD
ncbi:MAG TPA: NADPH-dependent F420 reductase [Gammaproteobacteria bacterium]